MGWFNKRMTLSFKFAGYGPGDKHGIITKLAIEITPLGKNDCGQMPGIIKHAEFLQTSDNHNLFSIHLKCFAIEILGLFAIVPLLDRPEITGYSAVNLARSSFCFYWTHI